MKEQTAGQHPISFMTADDGCKIAVRTLRTGSSSLPPMIAIHALAMDGSMWSEVVSNLSSDITVLALDCRGHGRSDKPLGPYSTGRFAKDVLEVLDQSAYPRAILVGCSMGGTIALAFAGRYPERLDGLSVFDTTAWYGDGASEKWEQRAQTALKNGMSALTEFQLERWFSPTFLVDRPDVIRKTLNIFLANDTAAYAECCRMLGHADERNRLGNYKGCAALAVGEDDFATPFSMAEEIAKHMQQAKVSVINCSRHFTPLEVPKEVAAQIEKVICEVGA